MGVERVTLYPGDEILLVVGVHSEAAVACERLLPAAHGDFCPMSRR